MDLSWLLGPAAQVAGKVFRIGHLGNMDEVGMLSAIAGAEMALIDAGFKDFTPGAGVGEAIKYWQVSVATCAVTFGCVSSIGRRPQRGYFEATLRLAHDRDVKEACFAAIHDLSSDIMFPSCATVR